MLAEVIELRVRVGQVAKAQRDARARDWRRVVSADVDLAGIGEVVPLVLEGWRLGWWTALAAPGGWAVVVSDRVVAH